MTSSYHWRDAHHETAVHPGPPWRDLQERGAAEVRWVPVTPPGPLRRWRLVAPFLAALATRWPRGRPDSPRPPDHLPTTTDGRGTGECSCAVSYGCTSVARISCQLTRAGWAHCLVVLIRVVLYFLPTPCRKCKLPHNSYC